MFSYKVLRNLHLISLLSLFFISMISSKIAATPLPPYNTISYPLPTGAKKPVSIAYSPDGTLLATENTGSNTLSVFGVGSKGSLIDPISYQLPNLQPDGFTSVAFSPQGTYLATADGYANSVTMFRVRPDGTLAPGTSYSPPAGSINPGAALFTHDGLYLATANNQDITVFSVGAGGTLTPVITVPVTTPRALAYSPDGFLR